MLTEERKAWLIEFGKRVKDCRQSANLTQDELASIMRYKHKTSISKIERGVNDIPQSTIVALADALNTTVEHLMGWEDAEISDSAGQHLAKQQSIRTITEAESLLAAWDKAPYNVKMSVYYALKDYGMKEPKKEEADTAYVS